MKKPPPLPPLRLIAYAQCAEDIVLHRAFENDPPGIYVDVGAGHPVIGSVTRLLYQRLHWHGIEIEPLPEMAALLREQRTGNTVVEAAVALQQGTCTLHRLPENWGMSTIVPEIAEHHENQGWAICEETVKTLPLDDILAAHLPDERVDVLKIDVEGAELQVLRSFNIQRWRPRVMVIEGTKPGSAERNHEQWVATIPPSLYQEVLFDGLNRFYVRTDEPLIANTLRVGANVFDQFIHLRWWTLLPEHIRQQYPELHAECPVNT